MPRAWPKACLPWRRCHTGCRDSSSPGARAARCAHLGFPPEMFMVVSSDEDPGGSAFIWARGSGSRGIKKGKAEFFWVNGKKAKGPQTSPRNQTAKMVFTSCICNLKTTNLKEATALVAVEEVGVAVSLHVLVKPSLESIQGRYTYMSKKSCPIFIVYSLK